MKRLSLLLTCMLALSACSTYKSLRGEQSEQARAAPVSRPAAAPQRQAVLDAGGATIETVRFQPGVSSTTVERLAKQHQCVGGAGAGLVTPAGPVEVYRMQCDDGRVFKAKCELRQCSMLAIQEAMPGAVVPGQMAQQQMASSAAVAAPAEGGQARIQAPITTQAAPLAASGLAPNQLPKLSVRWACGDCEPNPKVIDELEKNYALAAAASGKTVVDNVSAELTITQFRQRNPGVRIMFGILAGRDILKTELSYRGRTLSAEDYSANAWTGMNNICKVVTADLVRQMQ